MLGAHFADGGREAVAVQHHFHHADLLFPLGGVGFGFQLRVQNVVYGESQRDSGQGARKGRITGGDGFGVDAGMGCIADIQTQAAFKTYWAKRLEEDPDIDPYNDLFCDLMEENAKAYPKYQGDCGDWLNWTVPGTDCNLPIFASGWGDGYYPVYFGYDAKGKICAVYVRFIDIEASYREQD